MKRVFAYLLLFVSLTGFGAGCDYLDAEDECVASDDDDRIVEECGDLDDDLELCDPESDEYVPGCYINERCKGDDCKSTCEGDPIPCGQLTKDVCGVAFSCEWYVDPKSLN